MSIRMIIPILTKKLLSKKTSSLLNMREINTSKLILFVGICILTSCNNMDSTDFIVAEIEEEININEKELGVFIPHTLSFAEDLRKYEL